MVLTQAEENKNRLISAGITALLFGLLLLFLILFNMITPNPPFPLQEGGGGGKEMALGMITNNNDNVDYNTLGNVTDVVTEKNEKILTDENGEVVPLEEDRPEVKEEKTVIKPTKPKEVVKPLSEAEKIREKLKKTKNNMTNKKSRLGSEPKFAILKRSGEESSKSDNNSNQNHFDQSPKELVSKESGNQNYLSSSDKVEYTRITTQIDSKTDQQL